MAAAATAAIGAVGSGAPPKIVGKATITVTLQIVKDRKTARTVRFHELHPIVAADRRLWLKPGYWEVNLQGKNLAETRKLCKPTFCSDTEPGNASFGAPFNNLLATTTSPAPDWRKIMLRGSITISGAASFTDVTAWNWYSRTDSQGLGFLHTPGPITVVAGQRVYFTIEVSVPLGGA